MTQPTTEQIKKLWEWCGLKEITYQACSCHPKNIGRYWNAPDGGYVPWMPVPDLNNLFKYAVPKLDIATLDYDYRQSTVGDVYLITHSDHIFDK